MKRRLSARWRVLVSLLGMTAVSLSLFVWQVVRTHSFQDSYFLWNLFLAWIPLVLSGLLLRSLRNRLWSSWLPVTLSFLWLAMLPNSFYMISDYVHLKEVADNQLVYTAVFFTSFIITAALIGFASLYLIHAELLKRVRQRNASLIIGSILLVCSFAIYVGRDLRWNSWDILLNPAGLLFDVSDRFIHPFSHSGMLSTTISFFVLLGGLYIVGWQLGEATRQEPLG